MSLTLGVDTYISYTDAVAYATANGLQGFPTEESDGEVLLRRAAKAIDRRWGNRFLGEKQLVTQSLAWPRYVASTYRPHGQGETLGWTYDSDGNPRDFSGIPPELGEAQVELAVLIANSLDPLQQVENAVTESTKKLGDLESTKKYASPYASTPFYSVMTILRPLLKRTGQVVATRGA